MSFSLIQSKTANGGSLTLDNPTTEGGPAGRLRDAVPVHRDRDERHGGDARRVR